VNDNRFFSFEPGSQQMDDALALHYPEWALFRQTILRQNLTAGNVFEQAAFGGSEYGVNGAILLSVVGTDLKWQLPSDGNLFLRAVQAAKMIYPHYTAFYTEEQVRAAFPEIGNAPTYGLYRYFGKDLQRLETWCRNYVLLVGQEYPLQP